MLSTCADTYRRPPLELLHFQFSHFPNFQFSFDFYSQFFQFSWLSIISIYQFSKFPIFSVQISRFSPNFPEKRRRRRIGVVTKMAVKESVRRLLVLFHSLPSVRSFHHDQRVFVLRPTDESRASSSSLRLPSFLVVASSASFSSFLRGRSRTSRLSLLHLFIGPLYYLQFGARSREGNFILVFCLPFSLIPPYSRSSSFYSFLFFCLLFFLLLAVCLVKPVTR